MLANIHLKLFKCFQDIELPLSRLTLLSGANSSGKSSILQALALLHQTINKHEWSTNLFLNGDLLRLGTVSDVVDKIDGRREFSIGIETTDEGYQWTFVGEDRLDMSMKVKSYRNIKTNEVRQDFNQLRYLLPVDLYGREKESKLIMALNHLTYLTAERIGPRETYQLEYPELVQSVGAFGQHAVGLLYLKQDQDVLPTLALEGTSNKCLQQIERRMQTFFPKCRLSVSRVAQTNTVTLGIETSSGTGYLRPIHVGFGLTQVLPIIVAALSAPEGSLLLIENPEVHLHPRGQAEMGMFLAEVAHAGVQVILETHSDHILNGIRRAVKSEKIDCSEVKLHFFQNKELNTAQIIIPLINKDGDISECPDGFFDQFDKDINYFAGWGG